MLDKETNVLTEKERGKEYPPKIIEIGMLETIASKNTPSDAGAWWIMYQTAVSVLNYAFKRDPLNNAVLKEFWSDLASRENKIGLMEFISEAIETDNTRPLPYDDVMQIIDYCVIQLQRVFNNPRHSIVKVDKMVNCYKMRNTGNRTMDWLGKQPGKTIKEKLSGKNKMLTQVNEYSYDVKENQVAMMLYRQIMKRVNDRLNNGIEKNGYGELESIEINQMMKLKKSLRNSNISEVKPVNHAVANNVLLADKNYSVIWRAYLEMCKYDKHISSKWNEALNLFVKSSFIVTCTYFTSIDNSQIIEERLDFSDSSNKQFRCVVDFDLDKPLYIKLLLQENNIHLNILENNLLIAKYCLEFQPDCNSELLEKRGYPINIEISGEMSDKLQIMADISGINSVVNWCLDRIKEHKDWELVNKKLYDTVLSGTCVFDAVTNGEYITVNNTAMCNVSNTAVGYEIDEKITYFAGKQNCLYVNTKENISISDSVSDKLQTEALLISFENIRKRVEFLQDDYFIYTIPDSLEEFSQKKFKQCVKVWFPRSFPVWRSVAALTELLESNKQAFQSGNIFVSVDLMGQVASVGLLAIKREPRVQGYVCTHSPPFPEIETGEIITENYFLQNYATKFIESTGTQVDDNDIKQLVKSGIVRKVLKNKKSQNYTVIKAQDIHILKINYDSEIVEKCKTEWLDAIGEFWNETNKLLDKEYTIQFVNILNDVIMNFVTIDEINSIVKTHKGFKGSYYSDNYNVNKGAYVYLERLQKHKPTWTEYLPQLSLEVIKNGTYTQLELVGDNISFDVMGDDNEHIVEERLVLKASEKEFRFLLKKNDISRTSSSIEAYITDKSFPLDHDVVVKLSVKYKYGFDNSYELTLRPENPDEKAFDEIIVEWENVNHDNKYVNIWPSKIKPLPDENIRKEIEAVKISLSKIEESIRTHMVNYTAEQDKSVQIQRTDRFLTQNIFKIRNIIMSDLPEVEEFVNWMINSQLYTYLGQIADIFKRTDISENFFEYNKGEELSFFEGDCMQVMFSLGKHTPKQIQEYFVKTYERRDEKSRTKVMIDMLLRNGDNKSAIELLIKEIKDAVNQNTYNVKMDNLVKELGKMCCFDSELIYSFYEVDDSFINDMIDYMLKRLHIMLEKCKRYRENYNLNKSDVKRYLGYLEAILAILRLRDPERVIDFKILAVGSEEAKGLSNTIRELDEYMKHPRSSVRFEMAVEKPESLSKMSDLAYALDLYLNGDSRAATIEVMGVDE